MLLHENHHNTSRQKRNFLPVLLLPAVAIIISISTFAQNCPENIDFERGNFDGWTCYAGVTDAVGDENVISLYPTNGPIYGKHTLYGPNSFQTDLYGNFPVHCPNGSGHSVKLGSTEAGGQAEGISYEFTIPPNDNSFSLIYHYAVVFQSPNHRINEQPRMETEVFNVTDNSVISCASFSFIAVGSSLDGFQVSGLSDTINVLYKNWSAVSVDLSGNAGKTIRLFFKTADCTFRRHFGYAYIDVNTECSGTLTGSTYCPDDTVVNVVAPFGYQNYTWYDSTLTNVLGNQQVLSISAPVSGTTIAVQLEPYAGYGCPKTIHSRLTDTLKVISDAGADKFACQGDTLQIGGTPKPGLVYSWSPPENLSNPVTANPYVTQGVNQEFVLTTGSSGGGCRVKDSVRVTSSTIDNTLRIAGKDAYCFGHGDSSILSVAPETRIEWFKNEQKVVGMDNQAAFRVTETGVYYAILTDNLGCVVPTGKKLISVDFDRPGIRYPLRYALENVPLTLSARSFGESLLWSPAFNLSDADNIKPLFTGNSEQLYNIRITSLGGCITVDTQLVKIVDKVKIFVPTAFSPNNDNKNDYLHPILMGVAEMMHFRIYNRWGELMFEGKTELPGWDGYYKGYPQPPQAVMWTIECLGLDNVRYIQSGQTVLLR